MVLEEMVDPLSQLNLPPGFRFHPTDEELMVDYLFPKVAGQNLKFTAIGDVDLYKYDPWVLPSKASFGDKEWYFFSPRERKYPNGSRPNRLAGSGFWKATGTDKFISSDGKTVGIKKALVFYIGKAPRGSKTNWIMHEYRLFEPQRRTRSSRLDDWVLCRIYKKNSNAQRAVEMGTARRDRRRGSSSSSSSQLDEPLHLAMNDRSFTVNHLSDRTTLQNVGYPFGNSFDWATLGGLNSIVPEHWAGSSGLQFPIPNESQQGVMNSINSYNQNDMYVPSVNTGGFGRMTEQEVQSGFRDQRVDNFGFVNPNAHAQGFNNSFDPFAAIRHPNQPGNPGDRN